jgi:hypothetical protein
MTQREKELLASIYESVGTISSLRPENPADINAISHNLKIAVEGAQAIRQAISALGYGDHGDCSEHLEEADRILAQRPTTRRPTDA